MDAEENPSLRLIEQRIRNRIIEYLEIASSFDEQRSYQLAVPIADVPAEVIEMWADNNPVDQSNGPGRLKEPYSLAEITAMQTFHAEWEWVVAHTPNPLPELAATQQLPAWGRLREAAEVALIPFLACGRLPEDREV